MQYAGFGIRLAAYLLDALIGGVVIALPINLLLFGFAIESRPGPDEINAFLFQLLMVLGLIAQGQHDLAQAGAHRRAWPSLLHRSSPAHPVLVVIGRRTVGVLPVATYPWLFYAEPAEPASQRPRRIATLPSVVPPADSQRAVIPPQLG